MENAKKYYLGLDIGTDSVGYAASTENYRLLKYRQEPVWGVTTFEAASLAQERRGFRTQRRRTGRKKQRAQLIAEIFAEEITKVDPCFFIRRRESALFAEDTSNGVQIFSGNGITDKEYHKQYPTIHHLICDLMQSNKPHDIRLVYLACAWLVTNRGHFLFDVSSDNIESLLDFHQPYEKLQLFLREEWDCGFPWNEATEPEEIQSILQMQIGIKRKQELFKERLFNGKKPDKKATETFPLSAEAFVALLCGGKVKQAELFDNETYADVESISFEMDDEQFAAIIEEIDIGGELLLCMQAVYNCARLNSTQGGNKTISGAKVAVYEQHRKDLKWLKYFVKKYLPEKYYKIFRAEDGSYYTAYSGNEKNCKKRSGKRVNKDEFSTELSKLVKELAVEECDKERYEDMKNRLSAQTFLPKQKDTVNRIIPQQLYRYELKTILDGAEGYLPLLSETDENGMSVKEKILSVFDFRIPYFVGPLNQNSSHAWIERKAGKIYPWNFESIVDLDASEAKFIRRMTNTCTYLPGEDVLPVKSLLYSKFTVLNELNNLKINGNPIPVTLKQELYTNVYMCNARVTRKSIESYLRAHGYLCAEDQISGIDTAIKATLKTYHSFKRLLESKNLTEQQAEAIINHAAYSEDKGRMRHWLESNYPQLKPEDIKYILGLNLKEFGRLSEAFLTGIVGAKRETGEAFTVMEALWQTNDNLMQLLSERYTFAEEIATFEKKYYAEHPQNLSERLSEMYVSNAVKRPIIRTLDIVSEVVKAVGCAPERIFVEMARGGEPEKKGKTTATRKQQLLELYKTVKTEDARCLAEQLEAMGETADNRLQSDKLFLYYLQLGKCLYTGASIDLSRLSDGTYNIEHIYPQAFVKDDSILNNEILVLSTANGEKQDTYPISAEIRNKQYSFWKLLHTNKLMTDEKFHRLTRQTPFTEEEKHQFINRQLVETRQSTKAVAQLLKEKYPNTEIVYVKAGMVSEFRQEYNLLKSRDVNDLHHAKDAYLNIVVGNAYYEKFTWKWFNVNQKYSVKLTNLFGCKKNNAGIIVGNGATFVEDIRKTVQKNSVHLTRYAFCRKGGFFDQKPLKAAEGLVPRKLGLDTEKYGGYNKPTASFFVLTKCVFEKKTDVMILPIPLLDIDSFEASEASAESVVRKAAESVTGKKVLGVSFPLGKRKLKVNTVLSVDGMRMTINGKATGGKQLIVSTMMPLLLNTEEETYVKKLSSFCEKKKINSSIQLNETYDGITAEKNLALYDHLTKKLGEKPFAKMPGNQKKTLEDGREQYMSLKTEEQVTCLLNIVMLFSSISGGSDLTAIGGAKKSGMKMLSSTVSNWKKNYSDARIIDQSAAGLHESTSGNLLKLL